MSEVGQVFESLDVFIPCHPHEGQQIQVGQIDKKWFREEIFIIKIGGQSSKGRFVHGRENGSQLGEP